MATSPAKQTKHIFVTGGVVSSLGKGLTCASIGMLLERFGLWDARSELVSTFSRGMAQRLALCRSLLHGPELLILDEPYSSLDESGVELLDRELAELRATSTCIVATHDPQRLAPLASNSLALV